MKKRLISLALTLCLALSLGTTGVLAAQDETTALETVKVLGIMVGDENGNMNLSSQVTRAEFVKMMTAASSYKDTVGSGYGASLFKDVKSSHWASEYIKLGVEQGWFTGYVDGTFRPDNSITLEEGCTALLRLLGYDSGSLAGSSPTAQLSKAGAIGLLDDSEARRHDSQAGPAPAPPGLRDPILQSADGGEQRGGRLWRHAGVHHYQWGSGLLHSGQQRHQGPLCGLLRYS